MGEPAREGISTRLYPGPNDFTNKYKAHVLLTEDRDISKEQAVNELILIGARYALPKELTRDIPILHQPAGEAESKKAKAGK